MTDHRDAPMELPPILPAEESRSNGTTEGHDAGVLPQGMTFNAAELGEAYEQGVLDGSEWGRVSPDGIDRARDAYVKLAHLKRLDPATPNSSSISSSLTDHPAREPREVPAFRSGCGDANCSPAAVSLRSLEDEPLDDVESVRAFKRRLAAERPAQGADEPGTELPFVVRTGTCVRCYQPYDARFPHECPPGCYCGTCYSCRMRAKGASKPPAVPQGAEPTREEATLLDAYRDAVVERDRPGATDAGARRVIEARAAIAAHLAALRQSLASAAARERVAAKDAERWRFFRRFLSVECDGLGQCLYFADDEVYVEGHEHTVDSLVDAAIARAALSPSPSEPAR